MDFYDVIRGRYSVRAYQDRPVEEDKLRRILEAVRLAPSGSNRQPWRFVVVRDAATRRALVGACRDQAFIATAPVVIAGVGLMPDRVMSCDVPGDPVDVAIALEHLALAATAEGLGTCWVGAFTQDKVRALLGIPAQAKVIEVMALGYPADQPQPKRRKPLDEIVCYERWEQPETAGRIPDPVNGQTCRDGVRVPVSGPMAIGTCDMAEQGTFEIQVFTGEGLVHKAKAESAVFPAADGLVGILPGHAPLAAVLGRGTLEIRAGQDERYFHVSGGIAQFRANALSIFADECVPAEKAPVHWQAQPIAKQ